MCTHKMSNVCISNAWYVFMENVRGSWEVSDISTKNVPKGCDILYLKLSWDKLWVYIALLRQKRHYFGVTKTHKLNTTMKHRHSKTNILT